MCEQNWIRGWVPGRSTWECHGEASQRPTKKNKPPRNVSVCLSVGSLLRSVFLVVESVLAGVSGGWIGKLKHFFRYNIIFIITNMHIAINWWPDMFKYISNYLDIINFSTVWSRESKECAFVVVFFVIVFYCGLFCNTFICVSNANLCFAPHYFLHMNI